VGSFYDFALVCQSLGQTSSRLQIAQLAGDFLARLSVEDAAIAARFLLGHPLPQSEWRLQVSGRAIWRVVLQLVSKEGEPEQELLAAAVDFGEAVERLLRLRGADPVPSLTLGEVEQNLAEVASIQGADSRRRKSEILYGLFARASALEGKFLAKILIREMRHGLSEGLMLEAIASMAGRPIAEIRRAHMLDPDAGRIVRRFHPCATSSAPPVPIEQVSQSMRFATQISGGDRPRPIRPMLAASAPSIRAAFEILGNKLAVEYKLDGARVQIHCSPSGVYVFSRRMNEISQSLPEISEMVAKVREEQPIFDGEAIAVGPKGEALAFQELMRRFGRIRGVERLRTEQPIRLFVFDLLAVKGELLIDTPYQQRYELLTALAERAGLELAPRIIPGSLADANEFYARAIASGYEGVMAKALTSLYTPGARGRGWLKIKNVRTLDLVIVAADWGYGRRHGWLSNYHLAVRDSVTGEFIEVGKTFKGLSDDDFEEMTRRLQMLKIEERAGTVFVRPEVVVEVAYSDIQRSPRYPVGMALRFARILNIRADKSPEEADTTETLRAEYERQLVKPLKLSQ
jgi:DNA ligase-1